MAYFVMPDGSNSGIIVFSNDLEIKVTSKEHAALIISAALQEGYITENELASLSEMICESCLISEPISVVLCSAPPKNTPFIKGCLDMYPN